MKKYLFLMGCLVLLTSMFAHGRPAVAADEPRGLTEQNYRAVVDDVAGQVVKLLPQDNIHFRLLGIAAIEGDDGTLVDALTDKIKAGSHFKLIERKDLDQILSEQGIQLSPVADPRQPVEPGMIQGVEGLLLGQVRKKQCNPFFCNLEVFLKLNDVEGGEVVFAKSFSASYMPRSTVYGGAIVLALVLLVIFALLRKKSMGIGTENFIKKDAGALLAMQSELKKAMENLGRAHDDLAAKDMMKLSVRVREEREQMKDLMARLEQAPSLHVDNLDRQAMGEVKHNNRSMRHRIDEIVGLSDRVLKTAASGSANAVDEAVDRLRREIKDAANRLHERKAGRA